MSQSLFQSLAPLFELPHGSRKQFPPIEGLRGMATLLVFVVHYVSLIEPWLATHTTTRELAKALQSIGHSGVDLFFVLSGYLIYGGLIARPVSLKPYLLRRIKRIYPTFTAVFALYVAASLAVPQLSKIPQGASSAILYLAANYLLLPGMLPIRPMITVTWSLSFEMFFYLACPLAVSGLGLRRWPASMRILLFVTATIVIIASERQLGGLCRLASFLAGMTLHEVLRPVKSRWLSAIGVAVAVTGWILCYQFGGDGRRIGDWTAAVWISYSILCFAALQDDGWLADVFSWTPLRWFGNMSYSFFLLHGFVLRGLFFMLERVVPPENSWDVMFWVLLPPAFLLALIASAVLFLVIERPISLRPARSVGATPGS